ncbi:E3 ubiquitin-protein ligase RNF216-like [Xenia sp. Carnegie-2017]|uniref:E3 ubiquitin-protein ligase RNF216-like n=1 Tax=Xenia sp. Carnegie-2017 TaxID=2897299 RepID=UPI001F040DD7|nr:E3 ubiquitin-protein ligase RNF216-like [Xenia sp. Carnegie-2017]
MDKTLLHAQLKEIFPQVEQNVIDRTIVDAMAAKAVDVLSYCIDAILASQINHGKKDGEKYGNPDIIYIGSVKKKTLKDGSKKQIPLIYVKESKSTSFCHNSSGRGSLVKPQILDLTTVDSDPIETKELDENPSKTVHSQSETSTVPRQPGCLPVIQDSMRKLEECLNHMSETISNGYVDLGKSFSNGTPCPPSSLVKNSGEKIQMVEIDQTPLTVESPYSMLHPSLQPLRIPLIDDNSKWTEEFGNPTAVTSRSSVIHSLLSKNSSTPPFHVDSNRKTTISISGSATTISHTTTTTISDTATTTISDTATITSDTATITSDNATPQQIPMTTTSAIETETLAMSTLDFVQQVFPNVNVVFVHMLLNDGRSTNDIVNALLDRPDMQNSGKPLVKQTIIEPSEIDYFNKLCPVESCLYIDQCEKILCNNFKSISVKDIRRAMRLCCSRYAPTHKILEDALLAMNDNSESITQRARGRKFFITKLITGKRPLKSIAQPIEPNLQLELDFVKKKRLLDEERKNAIMAENLNKQQYIDEGEEIECGCCFGDFAFEDIVQCSDGHLFCKECLRGYAKEIIFGSSMASLDLVCMGDDCDHRFPYDQLKKCLSENEIEKYRERLQKDCLEKVDLPNLHSCPFCDFAAILPETERVFSCKKCERQSCVECSVDWKEHFGKRCHEIEKKSETNLRVSYEEKMTMAKVRKCSKCNLSFTKSDGCNKMTCRCGTTQCYICRKSYIDYNHFCRHSRDPGQKCTQCKFCSLWSDPSEDDELAIQHLEQEAAVKKRKLHEEMKSSYYSKKCNT